VKQTVPFSKRVAWRLQYWAALALMALLRRLSVDAASGFCGWLMRQVGPRLRAHKIARRNLTRTFPDMPADRVEQTLTGMWNNLGRIIGELPHAETICDPAQNRLEVVNAAGAIAFRDSGKAGLMFGGHIANWELTGAILHSLFQLTVHPIYRAPNNPLMLNLFIQTRQAQGREAIPKGRDGAKRSLELLKSGQHLGLLIDQKMNDGIELPFFGRPAMTAPALASFALKFGIEPRLCHLVRLNGARFRVVFSDPLPLPNSGNRTADIESLMLAANRQLEDCIRAHPEQWLWAHRRWKE